MAMTSVMPAAEALDLVEAATLAGAGVRLLGGQAVAYHCRGRVPAPLDRTSADIDLFVRGRDRAGLQRVLAQHGWEGEREFNLLNGRTRLLYHKDGTKLDVFVDRFRMCHEWPLADRLPLCPVTLPPADLLLTKLQVVEINRKDLTDSAALLLRFPLGPDPAAAIDPAYLAARLAVDWGLWRTVTGNLRHLQTLAGELPDPEAGRLRTALEALAAAAAAAPKSPGWRLRSLLGDRVPWYERPEEP
ncbi:conserved protein of unknown function [Candidatus Hydrogenisulfobacillus filiaventi]|uniref:Nucleotidyltransferase family protein n=1 Tax=Candidatus Hydrogenisulfobacillus filiaventi TaxID=2707344 RepID=A0A6F8ZIJ4_9FIRM|nr:conserved protein of unknown function [Candidatus Hydrogenisulfobacillus filiaventi]